MWIDIRREGLLLEIKIRDGAGRGSFLGHI